MNKLFVLLILALPFKLSYSQTNNNFDRELQPIFDKVIDVHSLSNLGTSRQWMGVNMPINTPGYVGYIYSISIEKIGTSPISTIIELAKNIPDEKLQAGLFLAELVLNATNDKKINFYIFTSQADANNFYNNKAFNYCRGINTGDCGYSEVGCKGNMVWFGFENQNLSDGLNVRLQVAAVILKPAAGNPYIMDPAERKAQNTKDILNIIAKHFGDENENPNGQTRNEQKSTPVYTQPQNTQQHINRKENYDFSENRFVNGYLDDLIERDSSTLEGYDGVPATIKKCVTRSMNNKSANDEYYASEEAGRKDVVNRYYNRCAEENIYKANAYLTQAIEYADVGKLAFEKGEYDKCIEFSNKALDMTPLFYAKSNVALCYLLRNKKSEALEQFKESIGILHDEVRPLADKRADVRQTISYLQLKNIPDIDEIISILTKGLDKISARD